MKRIHIVGAPRSGTTLMLELMVTGFVIDGFSRKEICVLTLPRHPVNILCTKLPRDTHLVAPLLNADPNQWFIFMLRDPRDAIVSRHGKAPDRYWTNLWQWRRAWNEVRPHAHHEQLLIIRYETLVREPDRVQAEIAARVPFLEVKAPFSQYHQHSKPSPQSLEAMRGMRPISEDSIGAWRRHKARIAGQLQIHGDLTQELMELGYEPDDRWLAELRGVEPDLSPGFWPEQPRADRAWVRPQQIAVDLPQYLQRRLGSRPE